MSIIFVQPCGPGTLEPFAIIATVVATPDDLLVNSVSMGGVPDVNILVNGDLVSSDYTITVNGA